MNNDLNNMSTPREAASSVEQERNIRRNKKKHVIPKASLVLIVMAAILLAAGLAFAASGPDILSESYKSEFTMTDIQAAVVENGETDDEHILFSEIGDSAEPGRSYDEALAVKNIGDSPVLVRMIIRRYWLDADGNKTNMLDPDLILLSYGASAAGLQQNQGADDADNDTSGAKQGQGADNADNNAAASQQDQKQSTSTYNTAAWQFDPVESTPERSVYYYSTLLEPGDTTGPVTDSFRIDPAVAEISDIKKSTEAGKTIYTYSYKYDGCTAHFEAEAQVLQSHNGQDAIESVWGVQNVKFDGSKVTVSR